MLVGAHEHEHGGHGTCLDGEVSLSEVARPFPRPCTGFPYFVFPARFLGAGWNLVCVCVCVCASVRARERACVRTRTGRV